MSFSIIDVYTYMLLIGLTAMMGALCGLLSYFLDYCFWPQSIFKWYLPWLAGRVIKSRYPAKYELLIKEPVADMGERLTGEAQNMFWYKILGGCSVCFNIWLALISWAVICIFTPLAWYYGFSYLLTSSWLIRKLVGATY